MNPRTENGKRRKLSSKTRLPRHGRRGVALILVLVLILILAGAIVAFTRMLDSDLLMSAAGWRGTLAFNAAEAGLAEVVSDPRMNEPATASGFAPDPQDVVLSTSVPAPAYYSSVASGASYEAKVQYLREGGVEESSALRLRTLIYGVSVTGNSLQAGTNVKLHGSHVYMEVYRFAPKGPVAVGRGRHYQ